MRQVVAEIHQQLVSFYEALLQRTDETPKPESVEVEGKIYELDTSDWENYKDWTMRSSVLNVLVYGAAQESGT